MEKATLKTIREYLAGKDWSIETHESLAYVYNVTSPSGNVTTIRVPMPTSEFHKELTKADTVNNFIKKYVFDPNTAPKRAPRTSASRAPINVDTNYIGLALKNRRKKTETVITKVEDAMEAAEEQVEEKVIDYNTPIPRQHNGYYFPRFTTNIMARCALGRNIFLSGSTGTGKSEFVENLADLIGQKVVRVNFSVGTTEAHMIGKTLVRNGSTYWIDGIVTLAMRMGWWLLFDEVDYAQPEHLACVQPVLEGKPLMLIQNDNEEVIPHENFRIWATANTKGRGDETQSYTGTNILNMAWLDRWSIFEMTYTEYEKEIVKTMLSKDSKLADQVIQYFDVLRKIVDEGQLINTAFSTRRLQQVCEMLAIGEALRDVLKFEVEFRYDKHEAQIITEIAGDVWDKGHYLSKPWKIGDDHLQSA